MERGRHPRISREGESIISGTVFTKFKFVFDPRKPVTSKPGFNS